MIVIYLHLGQDVAVKYDSIVGIFDMDTSTVSKITRDYLKKAQDGYFVYNVTFELPKSFVVCREDGENIVYISQLSSATLKNRMKLFKL